jgi:hypothetical protein
MKNTMLYVGHFLFSLDSEKTSFSDLLDGAYVCLYYYSDVFPSLQAVVLYGNTCNRKILISQILPPVVKN